MTQTNFPSSLSENYQYDADNNPTSKTDRKSQTITFLYDALNRLTSKTYPDTTAVDYDYDLRLKRMVGPCEHEPQTSTVSILRYSS